MSSKGAIADKFSLRDGVHWMGLIVGLSAIAPVSAMAGEVWTMEGRCTELRVPGYDFTIACSSKVVNANNDRGQVAFIFPMKNGGMVTFVGNGAAQVSTANQTATQPVSEVVWSMGMQGVADKRFKAAGTCKYGNAFAGVTQVTCAASTKDGDYSAKFTTSGQQPRPGY